MNQLSYLSNGGLEYIENLYANFRTNPESVDAEWRRFFEGFEFATTNYPTKSTVGKPTGYSSGQVSDEIKVLNLIAAYRSRGHLYAKLNPILPDKIPAGPDLHYSNFGLTDADLEKTFQAGNEIHIGTAKLKDIITHLENTYCRTIGAEYKFIRDPRKVAWLEERMEVRQNQPDFTVEEKKHILRKVGEANTFETFLHKRFVGQKRFSLEGGEALIPALDVCITHGARLGNREFVFGMAHRGRLNVLTNIMRKEYDNVFSEFEGRGLSDDVFDGDVKYHLGYSTDLMIDGSIPVHLSLVPNPSHLEAVNPVVAGVTRAKMDYMFGGDASKVCPILIHGDASLAGQGVVYEMIQMSGLNGYQTGGTVHVVINNQIGFTTDPSDSRTSTYCTDVAKVTLSPVFHVNGDDAEAVAYVTKLAMDYRQAFGGDVFVDIVCYRKYGHNEGDEPRFTNPIMYNAIAKQPTPFEVYSKKLLTEGTITEADLAQLNKELADYLNKEWEEAKVNTYQLGAKPRRAWEGIEFYKDYVLEPNPDTTVDTQTLTTLAKGLTTIPAHLQPHKNVQKIFADRLAMFDPEEALTRFAYSSKEVEDVHRKKGVIDWGMAEALAFASILHQGKGVRITGQDVERGTFSHRHAVIKDINTQEAFNPIRQFESDSGKFFIYNSLLSEFAVMGFEFGYSMAMPQSLVIWEAQYGDFCNGAQIIIDQFITACKTKWQRMSGLTLLLPHGYEGGGPEHSSARLERFLILCAENNMYVCNFTSPANYFHALRRQVLSNVRRPLIVFTPKSLLKLAECKSHISEFTSQGFREIIDDDTVNAENVKRVIVCTGKIYYDLLKKRSEKQIDDVALVRLEQLFPIEEEKFKALIKKYKNKNIKWVWAQEEPINMGAWAFIQRKYNWVDWEGIGRKESASPATASGANHKAQEEEILNKALGIATEKVAEKKTKKEKEPVTT
jgi:2-oxoglutarate dehydrogenase E1 component